MSFFKLHFNIHSVADYQKIRVGPFGYIEKISKKSNKAERGELSVPKKVERGTFCFGMVLYFMLEALNAFKINYSVLMVKVHSAEKTDRVELTKKN